MGIRRGVSLPFSGWETKALPTLMGRGLKAVHELEADGIELCCAAVVKCPSVPVLDAWRQWMAQLQLKAVTLVMADISQDTDHKAAARLLNHHLHLASAMGFENVCTCCAMPIDSIERALPTAEALGVRIGKAIRAPFNLRSDIPMYGRQPNPYLVEELVELADRRRTRFVGLVQDMDIFRMTLDGQTLKALEHSGVRPQVAALILEAIDKGIRNPRLVRAHISKWVPDASGDELEAAKYASLFSAAAPSELTGLVPYILSIRGRFYEMTEIPGRPGQYEDTAVNYRDPIHFLKKGGYDGYICSACDAYGTPGGCLQEVLSQVGRHQEMLKRLIETV